MLESDDIYGVNIRSVSDDILQERAALTDVSTDEPKISQMREIWAKSENYNPEWLIDQPACSDTLRQLI